MIAIIGGTSIFSLPFLKKKRIELISTKYGNVRVYPFEQYIVLNRHGIEKNIPPHKINHSANLMAIKFLKIKNFRDKGIYAQTKGPRFETKAEVKLLKDYADIVGMTLAKEATVAKELDLEYASICSIDNYANGVINKPLSYKVITQNVKENLQVWENIINNLRVIS